MRTRPFTGRRVAPLFVEKKEEQKRPASPSSPLRRRNSSQNDLSTAAVSSPLRAKIHRDLTQHAGDLATASSCFPFKNWQPTKAPTTSEDFGLVSGGKNQIDKKLTGGELNGGPSSMAPKRHNSPHLVAMAPLAVARNSHMKQKPPWLECALRISLQPEGNTKECTTVGLHSCAAWERKLQQPLLP